MAKRALTAVSRLQGANRALKEGDVSLPDFDLRFEEVSPLPRAFRRMVREGAYDVSEMALTTFITARAHGAALTGIPVFLVRDFHHKAIVVGETSGIVAPSQLEGRRVGVNRGFTVTTGVWARAILAEEHGVDLDRVTWARSGDEHVPDWRLPFNVEDLGGEGTLEEQLERGALPAAVGLTAGAATRSLIEDPFEGGRRAMAERGFYPINHLVVVRDEVLAELPDLAIQLFDAFAEAKRRYVDDLKAGRIGEPGGAERVHLAALEVMDDPLPYGVASNRAILETLMRHAVAQRIIDAPIPVEDLFAPELRGVSG